MCSFLDIAPRAWSGDLDGLGVSRGSRDFGNNAPIIYKKIYAKIYKKMDAGVPRGQYL